MLIRGVSVSVALFGRAALTKFRAEPMSGSSRQVNLPLHQSASRSKILSALDTCLSTTYFRPDEDGVDLTTDENNALSELEGARLMGSHPSGASS